MRRPRPHPGHDRPRRCRRCRRPARRVLAALALGAALALTPAPAVTQGANTGSGSLASLVADQVLLEGRAILARGNVEIFYRGARLSAASLRYDSATGRLEIAGPIRLTDENGTVFLADAAELSADLREGVLESARLVLDQQLQIAAAEINRVGGRYTQMTRVIASSCQVCAGKPVPLWAIRARRVVHDQERRQLYFYGAQLRFADVPVFYLPRLRLPDPSVRRATGFLVPRLRFNSQLGTGARIPFFLRLGDHADLTFAPFVTNVTSTLETRYRQALRFGSFEVDANVSRDTLLPGTSRWYLTARGDFDLPLGFGLSIDLARASDPAYLSDYGWSRQDRLQNIAEISRVRRDQYIHGDLINWQTLRASEIPIADQLPFAQSDFLFEQRWHPGWPGGEVVLRLSGDALVRESALDMLGRDLARSGAALSWRRDWILPAGLVASAEAALAADGFVIGDDSRYATLQSRTTGGLALRLALPMARSTASGASEVLEPVVQLAWSAQRGPDAPNDDSVMVEFDPSNLFALSRFPGQDAVERGLRANIGLTWSRIQPGGLSFTLTGGKVLRQADPGQFSAASGLDGLSSDWLLAGQVSWGERLFAQGRALIADDFSLTRAETLIGWQGERLQLSAGQTWLIADPLESRPNPLNEWNFSSRYQISDGWAARFGARYDAFAGQPTRADLGIEFRTECLSVDLSLTRNYASSGSVTPSTDLGFSVELAGIGTSRARRASGCSG